ncbi:MAG: dTDP-4-dehydrorhamnose reductase [Patescibacteria group bacterium]
MNVLVLGSEGMLGTALMSVFENAVGYDKEELDITDRDMVLERVIEREPDLVINAAGYTNVDSAESNAELANMVNGEALYFISEACAEVSAPLVHFSTDYVFDGKNGDGYSEDSEPNPINEYGRSKLAGEKAILESLEHYYIVRTSWLFGPNGKNFVDAMLRLGAEKDKLQVVHDQVGNPTFTLDLARAVEKMIVEGKDYGIYHLTNSGSVSWYEFAKEIFELKGMKVDVEAITSEEFLRPAVRPLCSILKNSKLPGLRPHKEALDEYLKSSVY